MTHRLVYFKGMGRAEMSRMLVWHAKATSEVQIESVEGEEWVKLKQSGTLRNGQLPVLFVGDKCLNESAAILRYLGRKYGYYPQEPMDAWLVDSTIDFVSGEMAKLMPIAFQKKFDTEEGKKAASDYGQKVGAFTEKQLKEHGKDFLCGDKLTIADFDFMAGLHAFFYNPNSMCPAEWRALVTDEFAKFELLQAYHKRYDAIFAEWMAQRPATPF